MFDVHLFMRKLSVKRPLFHSEADFQHAFAWQLHEHFPHAKIRLEYPFQVNHWIYVDIWMQTENQHIAIELKYKTALFHFENMSERYHLKNQSAQDTGRYDFLKDIQRLEQITEFSNDTSGMAIMLTNDKSYWLERQTNAQDSDFRLHKSRQLTGIFGWGENASLGTTKGRANPLNLKKSYSISWHPYTKMSNLKNSDFRYLALEVFPQG